MKKIKRNQKALFYVTLFLLFGAAAGNGVCQQQQTSARFSQLTETNRADFGVSAEKYRGGFYTKTEENADSFDSKRQTTYTRPTREQRLKRYVRRTFGPYALLSDALSAGVAQLTDTPEEWENNAKGYARRLGSTFGRSVINQTTTYGLDEALKLDSNFYRSGSKKFGDRFKNAFLSTFTARKPNGKRVFGAPRITGTYASSIIATEAWYPPSYNYKDGLRIGTFSLGFDVAINLLREYLHK